MNKSWFINGTQNKNISVSWVYVCACVWGGLLGSNLGTNKF